MRLENTQGVCSGSCSANAYLAGMDICKRPHSIDIFGLLTVTGFATQVHPRPNSTIHPAKSSSTCHYRRE